MKATTMSSKGQIAIPKEIRDTLQIKTGDQFTVEVAGNTILLKPAVTIMVPKEQAYFWAPEVQEKLRNAEINFQNGKSKHYATGAFLKELEKRR